MSETRMIDDTHLWELLDEWERRRRALGIPEPPTDLAAIDLEVQRRRLQQKGEASNRDDTHSLSISVHVFPAQEQKGKYATVAEVVEDYLRKNRRQQNFREVSRAWGTLVGVDAVEIEIGYIFPLPINSVNAKETPIMERKIVFKKGAQFYELTYTAVAEDYYAYLESFRDAVSTFKFQEEREQARVFQPLVTLTLRYAVREEAEEYKTDQ